ncbi:MAG: hypothetical protein ACTHKB_15760, partial [Burkholderiaceae bacterium]
AAPQGQPEPVAYLIDWPDEPDLGHYFAEEASTTGRSRPLYLAPPASSVPAIDIDDRYAGRLALLLECMLIDPHGYWSEAAALLDEYKAEWERVNPSPPLFMGEPMPPERREILRKLREKRQAARAEGRSKPPNRAVARFLRAARPKAAPAH